MDSNNMSRMVFLNPNFKNTHINPNFIISKPSTIHINPAFLQNVEPIRKCDESKNISTTKTTTILPKTTINQPKIISKSRTKIVRESATGELSSSIRTTAYPSSKTSLVKIGNKKLIRKPIITKQLNHTMRNISFKKVNVPATINNTNAKGKYKLDRRTLRGAATVFSVSNILWKKQSFISKYSLSRFKLALKENLSATKVLVTTRKLNKIGSEANHLSLTKKLSTRSANKKLEMLNINGVLYKSTRNKLLKTNINTQSVNKKTEKKEKNDENSAGKWSIYIRGDKFVLDKSGHSLTRTENNVHDENMTKLKRIDIGGLTYVAKSQNVFVRTNIHKARNHLSSAKQKSISVLSQKLTKSNIPCPIFRKLGKCAAFEHDRCPKVHDKMHVNICPKFLKGECSNDKCLLSHDVTLSKMPTCKFFLQGCCVRDDCPYLHKKLSEKAEICLDFLKGFCHLAEKCNKRHEFVCPDFDSNGKCEKPKCPYCRKRDKKATVKQQKPEVTPKIIYNSQSGVPSPPSLHQEGKYDVRYFLGERVSEGVGNANDFNVINVSTADVKINSISNDDNEEEYIESSILRRRPKLGDLPAYIPL